MRPHQPNHHFFHGSRIVVVFCIFLLLLPSLVTAEDIEHKPLSIGAFSEFGMLQAGRFGSNTQTFTDEWMDNFGAYIIQSSTSGRWSVNVGIGGIFQFQKPEVANPLWGGTQYRSFFIGPAVAEIEYLALDNPNSHWMAGMGMFGYKYNPDASNLGEYLFRSGPYPTYIMTGAYSFINNASTTLQGLKTSFSMGDLTFDAFFTTETVMPPLYDLSLAGVLKYKVADGLMDLGFGVNLKRLIPIRPSKTSVKSPGNAWFIGPNGQDYFADPLWYGYEADFYAFKLLRDTTLTTQDSALFTQLSADAAAKRDSVTNWIDTSTGFSPDYNYYTQSGILLDATLAFDLKKLLPEGDLFGENDLRLFAEVALLGVKNHPVLYTSRWDRFPVMVGINLPGFQFLDLISVQYEYFNSPHVNSFSSSVSSNRAIPELVDAFDPVLSHRMYKDQLSRDNHSWSVMIKKELTTGVHMTFQAARDHARLVSEATWAGPFLDPNEVFYKSSDPTGVFGKSRDNWYWATQLSFGI